MFCVLLLMGVNIQAQSVTKTMLRLPDTGQKTSYTSTFGEDNDYNINTPFFLKNVNGTVVDTITSLMWQQSDGGEMTIEDAYIYCDTLTLGGYSDWRLPNAQESFSILNHQYSNPALDINIFTKTAAEYWWTSEYQLNDKTKVWCTNAGGGIGNHPKSETVSAGGNKKFHVRAVRDVINPISIPNHFIDNLDSTITDNITLLEWQHIPNQNLLTWEQALIHAENLTLAGYSDWRLPNIKELQSLNDETHINPSVNPILSTQIGIKKYWSSTTLPNQTLKAWYWDTQFGITTYDNKTNSNYVMCVRNKTSNTGINSNEILQKNIFIYPNPASDFIQLPIESYTNPVIHIYNIQGTIVETLTMSKANKTTDISLIPNGIYWISIVDEHYQNVYKLIISR